MEAEEAELNEASDDKIVKTNMQQFDNEAYIFDAQFDNDIFVDNFNIDYFDEFWHWK